MRKGEITNSGNGIVLLRMYVVSFRCCPNGVSWSWILVDIRVSSNWRHRSDVARQGRIDFLYFFSVSPRLLRFAGALVAYTMFGVCSVIIIISVAFMKNVWMADVNENDDCVSVCKDEWYFYGPDGLR